MTNPPTNTRQPTLKWAIWFMSCPAVSGFFMPGGKVDNLDYWKECISIAADECGLEVSEEQLSCLAESVSGGHENYGMAFYSPPSSDRFNDLEREWEKKYKDLERTLSKYQRDAETAVKQALRVHGDANISIGEHGEVLHHSGRTTRIQ